MPILTAAERVGTTVGAYRLDRILGEGGMGVVFAGAHATLGTPAAIKLLHPHLVTDASVALRFEREARAAASIRHPNVVRILDLITAPDGARCIVMDLLEGETLGDLMQRERVLSPERAASLLLPVMDALAHAHAAGIVHRDLKPDNVFVARVAGRETPMLLDFGIAKLMDASTRATATGMMIGTPAYMAPEQARGIREIGPRTDVWAMGAVFFECLAGRTPLVADTPQGMIASLLTETPPTLREVAGNVPTHLADAIDRALAKDPAQRHPDMPSFSAAVRAGLGSRAADAIADTMLPSDLAKLKEQQFPVPTPMPDPTPPAHDARPRDPSDVRGGPGQPNAAAAGRAMGSPMAAAPAPRSGSRGPLLAGAVVLLAGLGAAALFLRPQPEAAVAEADPESASEVTSHPDDVRAFVPETTQRAENTDPVPTTMGDIDELLERALGGETTMRAATQPSSGARERSADDLQRVIRQHAGSVRVCGRLAGAPSETVRVRIVIGEDGRVEEVAADEFREPVRECVTTALRRWRFGEGPRATVSVPIRFSSEGSMMDAARMSAMTSMDVADPGRDSRTGTVLIIAQPWAVVYDAEGRRLGNTPFRGSFPPGPRTFRLIPPDQGFARTVRVEVRAGETSRVVERF